MKFEPAKEYICNAFQRVDNISITDVVILQKWLFADSSVTLKNWKNADICEDNRLDAFDLVMMKKQLIEK